MSGALSLRFVPRGPVSWGITWGVGVGIVEYLAVAPIDDWGSLQQLFFWLLYWLMPFWCALGCLLVWLADHHERIGSRGRATAAFLALWVLAAGLQPALSIGLIRLTIDEFPGFERHAVEAGATWPKWENWSTLSMYQLWEMLFYGSLLVAARILTVRVERTRRLLHQSAMARSRAEALLDAARLEALQSQIDPNLLLDSMQELEQRYRASPERAERLLEALVEFLRSAMHGLRVPVSTLEAELQLARAFSQLQKERGLQDAWRIVQGSSLPAKLFSFPSLLMLPLMALGSGGRPMLRVRAENGKTVLSLLGLSRSVSPELQQQMKGRLYALYGDRFHVESQFPTPHQLTITLQAPSIPTGESHA